MNRPFIIIGLAMLLVTTSCERKSDPEAMGQQLLRMARVALAHGTLDDAKHVIDSLRKTVPTALNAREEAILLLDSINLVEAKCELDAVTAQLGEPDLSPIALDTLRFNLDEKQQKVRFFEKKIEHDKANFKKH